MKRFTLEEIALACGGKYVGDEALKSAEISSVERDGRQCAVVCFEPITGRTHQLRVHAAHKDGLDCPIVGDALYGATAERLMLHAACITFVHPVNKEVISLECESDFFC